MKSPHPTLSAGLVAGRARDLLKRAHKLAEELDRRVLQFTGVVPDPDGAGGGVGLERRRGAH